MNDTKPNANAPDKVYGFLDPYDEVPSDKTSLIQCRVSTEDWILIRNLGEKRGLAQTTLSLLWREIALYCREHNITDYTHQNEYKQLITRIVAGIRPTGRGTVELPNGQTTHGYDTSRDTGTGAVVENIQSVATDSPLGANATGGRTGRVDNKKSKRATSKASKTGQAGSET